jgi:hypothetical protein
VAVEEVTVVNPVNCIWAGCSNSFLNLEDEAVIPSGWGYTEMVLWTNNNMKLGDDMDRHTPQEAASGPLCPKHLEMLKMQFKAEAKGPGYVEEENEDKQHAH